jgi:molecular chaperone GrpE
VTDPATGTDRQDVIPEPFDGAQEPPQETVAPGGDPADPADAGALLGADPGHAGGTPAGAEALGEEPGDVGAAEPTAPADGTDLDLARAAVAGLTNDLQRLQAEYVNYKRRVDRDRQLVKENATFSVLSSLLPVLDDLDRAREHGELEGGFKAVADALERIVAAHGLVKFGKPGDEFDPRFHEALMHSHSPDVTTTTCRDIVTAGYSIGDRVVRPAKVTVVDPEPSA